MVMVAACRDEGRLRAHALHQLEAQHAAIKAKRAIEVGNLEMNVADTGAGRDRTFWVMSCGLGHALASCDDNGAQP